MIKSMSLQLYDGNINMLHLKECNLEKSRLSADPAVWIRLLETYLLEKDTIIKGERNISCRSWSKVLNKPFILMQEFSKSALK